MERSTEPRAVAAEDVLTGPELQRALVTSAEWLDRHAEAINALNVFPVPDGDTGLNMALTLRSAVDYVVSQAGTSVSEVTASLARGALMGARGNSGVILAQLLRGLARSLEGHEVADAGLFAQALESGAEAAYTAVANPVEGTILTVARVAARCAKEAAHRSHGLVSTLDSAHRAARVAVAETPEQLPILKQASVVDAGGEGYRVFLEGMLKDLRGEPLGEAPVRIDMRADLSSLHGDADAFYGYCTEVLFQGEGLDMEVVRQRLAALGTCVLVVGDPEMVKVHVHTWRPGAVLDIATELGEILSVKVDNMGIQQRDFARAPAGPAAGSVSRQAGTALVAVAHGDGFQRLFASLGAVVVPGGQTMNPSVKEIVEGIGRAPREGVIVVPNNRNVVLAAEEAARLIEERSVAVVPTRNLPQGVAAALALNPEADVETNISALSRAMSGCHAIEMTRAVRTAQFDGFAVEAGSFLVMLDDQPVAGGPTCEDLIAPAVDRLPPKAFEIATVYVGGGGTFEEARILADAITARLGAPTEIALGGQPHYEYVISIE